MQKSGIIYFFFVDDMVFIFKKKKSNKVKQIVDLLSKLLTIKVIKELK